MSIIVITFFPGFVISLNYAASLLTLDLEFSAADVQLYHQSLTVLIYTDQFPSGYDMGSAVTETVLDKPIINDIVN